MPEGDAIPDRAAFVQPLDGAELCLLYAAGKRPSADHIVRHAQRAQQARFGIAHQPSAAEGWVELLSNGLSFDCHGLAPAAGVAVPPRAQAFGLPKLIERRSFEAIGITPGPHLREGGPLLPIVRGLVGLGEQLAQMPGVNAVCWVPAASWMEPDYFARIARDWLNGGVFPALGLTSLERDDGGCITTCGLGYFTRQEVEFLPKQGASAAQATRLVVRLIDALVYSGPLSGETTFAGPEGEVLEVSAPANGATIRVNWVS